MRPLRRFGLAIERAFSSEGRPGRRRGQETTPGNISEVLPQATDPTLTGWRDPHLAATPPTPAPTPHLWIFLGGSYGRPQRQVSVIEHMASLGHWAINLRYPNDWTIGGLSRRSKSADTHEGLRLQILDGHDRLGMLELPPQDAILNRLEKLLLWLTVNQPGRGWEQFLHGSEPRWDRLSAAGHSQGGGHVAILGKTVTLERVVMLSAPADCVEGQDPASWLSREGATPAERYFGFCHRRDPAVDRILAGWAALGLGAFGPVVTVDSSGPPYDGSHQLITDVEVRDDRHHGSVAVDRSVPRQANGSPVFQEAWTQLFSIS